MMNKTKFLTLLVVLLLLLNLTVLGFFFFNRPNEMGRNRPMPQKVIIEKLHFDKNQQAEYKKLIDLHQIKVEAIDKHIKESKNNLYLQLSKPENVQKSDSIISVINNYQKEIEVEHYNHFLEIKKMCHPDQLKDFNELTLELSKIFSRETKPDQKPDQKPGFNPRDEH